MTGDAPPRPLTDREAALVRWLLAPGRGVPPDAAARWDVPALRVVGRCPCGCASVDFAPAGAGAGMTAYRDWFFPLPECAVAAVFLFDYGGEPGGLEVWSVDGLVTPADLPTPEALRDAP